jgi:hypothetical protein
VGLVRNGAKNTPGRAVRARGERPFWVSPSPSNVALLAAILVSRMTVPGSALHGGVGGRKQFAAVRTRPQTCGAADLE